MSDVGAELRLARHASGLTQARVARACGLSASYISLIERARAEGVSVIDLARIASVVGLDLTVRSYPGASPLRDAAHRALLERFRAAISGTLTWRTEVPLPNAGDQRAWDAVIVGRAGAGTARARAAPEARGASDVRTFRIGVEAETRPRDAQALQRRLALKRRDGGVDHVLLVLAATRGNRDFLRAAGPALAPDFPVAGRDAMAALAVSREPAGSAIVLV